MFAPNNMNTETQETLKALIGERVDTVTPCRNTVSNTPIMFATPSGVVYQAIVEESAMMREHDGWKVSEKVYEWASENDSLGTKAINMLAAHLFKERPLTAAENKLKEDLLAEHKDTGETRYLGRDWWLHQYGLLGPTPLPSYYKCKMPCYGQIIEVTGLAGKGNSAQPCGRARYCENCEKVIQQLDQGYHFIVLVNGTTNIITRALGLWRRGSDGAEWTRPENWDRRHQCGISCPHNPSQGS